MKQVRKFNYLERALTEDGKRATDIQTRTEVGNDPFQNLSKVTEKNFVRNNEQRAELPVLFYISEYRTISSSIKRRDEATEICLYRRTLKPHGMIM